MNIICKDLTKTFDCKRKKRSMRAQNFEDITKIKPVSTIHFNIKTTIVAWRGSFNLPYPIIELCVNVSRT